MKITADTNLLCRIVLNDDPDQKARVVRAFEAQVGVGGLFAMTCAASRLRGMSALLSDL